MRRLTPASNTNKNVDFWNILSRSQYVRVVYVLSHRQQQQQEHNNTTAAFSAESKKSWFILTHFSARQSILLDRIYNERDRE